MDTSCTRKVDGFPCRYELGHAQKCDVDFGRHYDALEAASVGSAKINRLIAQARSLGLDVDVDVAEEEWYEGCTNRTVKVEIARPRIEATNTLEVLQQAERLIVGWSWIVRNGNTPKLYSAREVSYTGTRTIAASHLKYAVQSMGEN